MYNTALAAAAEEKKAADLATQSTTKSILKGALGLGAIVGAAVLGYYIGGTAGELLLRASRELGK